MRTTHYKKLALYCSLCVALVLAGCDRRPRVKHTRTIQVSAALAPGSAFGAETYNGAIAVTGAEVADCNLTATIVARALTAEEAQALAEKVKVKLVASDGKLETKIARPPKMRNQSVSVSLDVRIPSEADLHLKTHNGAVKISKITGNVDGTTYNGAVTVTEITGQIKLTSHNGKITCKEVSGEAYAKTYNGAVAVSYSKTAASPSNISLTTHNGSIDLTTPPDLSARIAASTHNGSIKSDLPITVSGEIGKTRVSGTIGTGEGKVELETHNGSIRIR
ncbi:MAG: DUF4097 family beta strand repeat protein [Phycisphaerae bacterium]|nr:DUF4097 family beta strand repeat protein [Phycisphaerae bacterium]